MISRGMEYAEAHDDWRNVTIVCPSYSIDMTTKLILALEKVDVIR